MNTIVDVLRENKTKYPNDLALIEFNPELEEKNEKSWKDFDLVEPSNKGEHRRTLTWDEFDKYSNRVANMFIKLGYKKGDKVAILLMNSLEWLPIYFGVLKAGLIAVPLNFRYTADEIEYCLDLSDASALVFGPEFTGRIEQLVGKAKGIKSALYLGYDCPSFADRLNTYLTFVNDSDPNIPLKEDDYAAIYFSSGTTGFPKAILHFHRALYAACVTENKHHGQTKSDIFVCIPPLYHTGAKMHWFGSFLVGATSVLLRGTKPKWILKAISQEKATICWLLVPWAQDILDSIENGSINLNDYSLSQWRLMHIGAQPVPPSLVKRWKNIFSDHEYDTNYGLSESTGPGCVHLGIENIHKVGAIGKAGYGWETKIVDSNRQEIKQGEVGELAVRGDGVMHCYYNDPKATDEILDKDGWLYTGDMAQMDEDGFIYLVDRKKDVIITGGENLYPVQIENFIRNNNKVKDVAVIGIPDERLGEIALAIIELKENENATIEEINEFCLDLPRYKRPRKVVFDIIPRNPTGKIEKPKLREKYCGGRLVEMQTKE